MSQDTDGDSIPDCVDDDDDGDGQLDADEQACGSNPLDANSMAVDTDGDSIPDCVDTDDDNDGQSDEAEASCGSDPLASDSISVAPISMAYPTVLTKMTMATASVIWKRRLTEPIR